MLRRFCLLLSLLCLPFFLTTPGIAQNQRTGDPHAQPTPERRSIKGIMPSPVLYYTPDTKLGFGASALGYFRLKSRIDTSYTRLSLARFLVDYTLNRQTDQWLQWNIFTREEQYFLRGELRHRIYRDRFYGIGNNTPEEDREYYRYNFIGAKLAIMRNVGFRTFIGPDIRITRYYDTELDSISSFRDSQLRSQRVPGYQPGTNSGLGLVLLVDHRDNSAFPSRGFLLEISSYQYGRYLGGDYNYLNFNLNFSRYFGIKPRHVIAVNTVLNLNTGTIPVMHLASAGGDRILRGYARNRFLEKNFAGTQAEYRFPLFWRIGMATFAGVGDVYGKPSDVRLSTLKYSLGAGVRYAINPKQKINSRLDVGYGREGFNVYLMIGEAF